MIWFDFGGVLSPPLAELYDAYERKTGITRSQLQWAMRTVADGMGVPTLAPVELALVTEAEWGRSLARALRDRHPAVDLSRARLETFGEQWFAGVRANPAMMSALSCARDHGLRVGILTNNVPEWEPYWKDIVAPAGEIECVIDSCKVGLRKPDPAIFELAARTAGADPASCVLVDDLAVNCDAARAQGWSAVHFTDDEQTLNDLARLTGLAALRGVPATTMPMAPSSARCA
ncbi:HAD family hydrolase [Streptomyces monticola]|uniref:HAD family hydrolase n=1 Tax=Streptomyces monticola TaxID=2666263 RepID=A0ABW2JX60_9ACTN